MNKIDISVVLPYLNEEKTILHCINKANNGIEKSKLKVVVVADNGSIVNWGLHWCGAKVYILKIKVMVQPKWWNWISIALHNHGDSDSTYNFEDIPKFAEQLDKGYDLVIGNRFLGGIEKGAMPFLNKFVGNPVLSFIAKKLFNSNIGDFHCGLRAFTKKLKKDGAKII